MELGQSLMLITNYLKDIWKIWIDLIYNAGGAKYFEMLGGEMEFEWLNENPYTEIKKYDVFYCYFRFPALCIFV